ncbi:MAG: OmpA family protein [Candidatus Azobacteroides sp.]|nr:OmpA family protein [Candidatus Azobacteroides sp.]
MKNLFVTAVLLLSALCVNAQKELAVDKQYPGDEGAQRVYQTAIDKQSNEKTTAVRTTWLANRPGDNWFISGQVGMGGLVSSETPWNLDMNPFNWFKGKDRRTINFWHPMWGASIGKWFSPVWGLRLNGTGRNLSGWAPANNGGLWVIGEGKDRTYTNTFATNRGINPYQNRFVDGKYGDYDGKPGYAYGMSYFAITVDYMLNLKNLFCTYNPNALFNPVLYGGLGYARTIAQGDGYSKKPSMDNIAVKGGLQLNFRLNRAFDIFLDGHVLALPDNFDRRIAGGKLMTDFVTNASIGVTYHINFRPFIKTPMYDSNEVDALNREINDLRNQLNNRPTTVCPPAPTCPPCPTTVVAPTEVQPVPQELTPVFFEINSAVVRDNQLVSVAKAAEFMVNNPGAKLELASYADKKTGTPAYNLNLSKKRSDAVAKLLVSKFGIDRKRLIVKAYGDKVQPFAENDLNRVTIFVHP